VAIGFLAPICPEAIQSSNVLEMLCRWRNNSREWHPDQSLWEVDSTREWIRTVYLRVDRLHFMVLDPSGNPKGMCGLSNIVGHQAEIYDVTRGEAGGHSLLFPYAEITMIRMAFFAGQVSVILGGIFENNLAARRMGQFVGFKETGRIPMNKAVKDNCPEQGISRPVEKHDQIRVSLSKEDFFSRFPTLCNQPFAAN
jgi:hypothetical protein